jgi:predicted metal-dependent peptidase
MSDTRRRTTITQEIMEKEFVAVEEKSRALATGIYNVTKQAPFLGSVLQCLNIMYSHSLPTAGIMFNTDAKRWDMYINPKFFCHYLNNVMPVPGLTQAQAGDYARRAILLHEISHITNKHPFRVPFLKISSRKRRLMNIAADMAINQFIKNLPTGCPECPPWDMENIQMCKNEACPGRCIDVKDFYDKDEKTGAKIAWKEQQTMEFYYEQLLRRLDDPDDEDGDGEGSAGGGANHKNLPNTIDEHMWDGAAEEKDMLEATEDLMKRAMIKQKLSYDELPSSIRELLQEINSRKSELDYRSMILSAIKRSASGHDRKHTWTRKSRRFGNKAPGTKVSDLPKLNMYLDTSGSISIEELNEFLEIVDNFLKAGSRKCRINLFNTENYYSTEYKLGDRLDRNQVKMGGTCLADSFKDIAKRRPDLAVFVTDGCYGDVEFEKLLPPTVKFPQTLFIISRQGTKDHPIKRLGMTVQIPNHEKMRK